MVEMDKIVSLGKSGRLFFNRPIRPTFGSIAFGPPLLYPGWTAVCEKVTSLLGGLKIKLVMPA